MYPEGDAGVGAPPADYGGGMKSKLTRNLEGLIPIILIIIIAAFLGHRFGLFEIPFLEGSQPMRMLVIGYPSGDMLAMLDQDKDIVQYRIRDAASLTVSPDEQLSEYNIVLLDQHLGGTFYDHSVSRELGKAIENFVRTGGKLIIVMDSGIYSSGGIFGTGVAADSIGWEVSFGDIVPVKCNKAANDVPTCTQPIYTVGRVWREDFDHRVMQGIEVAPADPRYEPLSVTTFDVTPTGNQLAYFKNVQTPSYFPAIVEKKLIIGKSIYFNYNPAFTPGIWRNTLEYLR